MAFSETPTPPARPNQSSVATNAGEDYPPRAQQQAAVLNQQAEAASRADENPEAVLAALDNTDGSPENTERLTELTAWVAKNLPNCQPHDLAAKGCLAWEDMMGWPITEEVPSEIEADVVDYLTIHSNGETILANTERNQTTSGEITDGVPAKISEAIGVQAPILAENEAARTEKKEAQTGDDIAFNADKRRTGEEVGKIERNADTQAELETLQTEFLTLKAEHGTEAALRQILAKATIPEAQSHIRAVLGRIGLLKAAIPGRSEALSTLIDKADIDLSATTVSASFGNLLNLAQSSPDFTTEEVAQIRAVIKGGDEAIRTGTDVLNTATATTIDPETGEEVPLHTADNKAEICPGVYTYTENGENAVLELNIDGHYHKMDVTGMDGMTVGLIAEMMSWQAATEAMGATSFVESVYKLDFDFTGGGAYDVFSLIQMRNRLTTLVGNFEGHDGDIFDPRTREGLIKDQMRAASPTGTALGWENDHHGSLEHSRKLGLHNDVVLEEFSRYIQNARALGGAIDPADIHANLYKKFPDLVEAPESGKSNSDLKS